MKPPPYKYLAKLLTGIAILVWIIVSIDHRSVIEAVGKASLSYILLGYMAFALVSAGECLRIKVLFESYNLTMGESTRLFTVGMFFANFFPSQLGQDVYKVYFLNRRRPSLTEPIALSLVLRSIALFTVLLCAIVYGAFNLEHLQAAFEHSTIQVDYRLTGIRIVFIILILVAILTAGAVYYYRSSASGRMAQRIKGLLAAAGSVRPRVIVLIGILSLMVHVARVARFYFFVRAVGGDVYILDILIVTALAIVASLLPITLAGLGVREGTIAACLSIFGLGSAEGMAVALFNRTALWIVAVIGGVTYLVGGRDEGAPERRV